MPIEILMPALSPTMTHGNLSKWLKKEGDNVSAGDVIAEIETDKATMEVEAIDEGIIGKIFVAEGTENVAVNELIAVLLEEGEESSVIDTMSQKQVAAPKQKDEATQEAQTQTQQPMDAPVMAHSGAKYFATPVAKRIAGQKNIDLSSVSGSGPRGRITKVDVENYQPNLTSATGSVRNLQETSRVELSSMRKVIAKRLLESKTTIPHFYLNIDCNMDKLLSAREQINESFAKQEVAIKISVNDFIIKAVAKALQIVPEANASWNGDHIIQYNNVDISVAVAIDGGLITPIIKNADITSLSDISISMKDLAKRAKANALKPEEFQGGGFSISNLGMYGIKHFNAIINPPQSCILAIGATTKTPVVIGDEVKIAQIMEVTLSSDHRVVDGTVGAMFLKEFKRFIENPLMLFV